MVVFVAVTEPSPLNVVVIVPILIVCEVVIASAVLVKVVVYVHEIVPDISFTVPVIVVSSPEAPAASSINCIEYSSPKIPVIVPVIVTFPPLY